MSHKEKIYEIAIQQPLTPARRKAVDKYLTENAARSHWRASFSWSEENDHLLHITTYPVTWDLHFSAKKVTVYGEGPFWTRLLFTEKKKAQLREGILHVLELTGFLKKKTKSAG